MARHRVVVEPLPAWLDLRRLLGEHDFAYEASDGEWLRATAELDARDAADLAARLRGVGVAGRAIECRSEPPLPRAAVRAARTEEARRMRSGSVGFSRKGARLDDEGRRSLTAEELALSIGRRAAGAHVLDACCGLGGNAIGFARTGCHVTAVELDPERLAMARHNATLYGVADRVRFVAGDAREHVARLQADLLFIDPPWGGDYDKGRVALADLPLLAALWPLRERFARTWLKVPPSFDPAELPEARPQAVFGVGEGDRRRVKFLLLSAD